MRTSAGPIPDSCSNLGEWYGPAERITFLAVAVIGLSMSVSVLRKYVTPVAVLVVWSMLILDTVTPDLTLNLIHDWAANIAACSTDLPRPQRYEEHDSVND